jgi:hypothetical protein
MNIELVMTSPHHLSWMTPPAAGAFSIYWRATHSLRRQAGKHLATKLIIDPAFTARSRDAFANGVVGDHSNDVGTPTPMRVYRE